MTEEAIFLSALEKKEPAERAAYLEAACAGNPALRERVDALLRSHEDPDSFLDAPALARQGETSDQAPGLPAEPDTSKEILSLLAPAREAGSLGWLDHYEVLDVVGKGGMGVVFRARDTKLQRIVAIKVLAPQLAANGT